VNCLHCGEEIIDDDLAIVHNNGEIAEHKNCGLREIIGSVAHLERRCSCFVPGSTEGDPPGMSRREAANAAVRLWRWQERAAERCGCERFEDQTQ